MSVKYYEELIQGSEEWLRVRLDMITASQVGKLVTPKTKKIANNEDSRGIVYEKLAERITGRSDDFFHSKYMDIGNNFEPFARDIYNDEVSPVREVGFIVRDFGDFKIGYSPDGLVDEGDGLIEIKCPSRNVHVKGICDGVIPAMYTMQMQTGMLVTGRKWCDYVSYFNGMKLNVIRMHADEELHALIIEAVKVFEIRILECIETYNLNTKQMPMANFIEGVLYE